MATANRHGATGRRAGQQDEDLEGHRRRQQCRHHHGQQAESLVELERPIDQAALESFAHEHFAAAARGAVQQEAADSDPAVVIAA